MTRVLWTTGDACCLPLSFVSAAGAHNRADEKTLRYLISEAGFIPQQRDILYRHVNREDAEEPLPAAAVALS